MSWFLVTTAEQKFWKRDMPMLFLGEWCNAHLVTDMLHSIPYEVLPYHWDDRERFYRDSLYLKKLYEAVLKQLVEILNQIHGQTYSERYWRILIGPFLYYFVCVFYDRYLSIQTAAELEKPLTGLVGSFSKGSWLPVDFPQFFSWLSRDDYNFYLYSVLLEDDGRIDCDEVQVEKASHFVAGGRKRERVLSAVKKLGIRLLWRFSPDSLKEIVFIGTRLSSSQLFALQAKLKKILMFPIVSLEVELQEPNWELREKIRLDLGESKFERLLAAFVRIHFPWIYLEGYRKMETMVRSSYPNSAKLIVTQTGWFAPDSLKFWIAQQVEESGAKLMCCQHGGLYGVGKWHFDEDHEVEISDTYVSWGWSNERGNTKILPLPSFHLQRWKDAFVGLAGSNIALILGSVSRYFYCMYSVPCGGWIRKHEKVLLDFVLALNKDVRQQLIVRLFSCDYGQRQLEQWKTVFPSVQYDKGRGALIELVKECKLCVVTYNTTAMLEVMVANVPTVLLWPKGCWELRDSAQPYYEMLQEAGILYHIAEEAAWHINQVEADPISWWEQKNVQKAREQFCEKFALTSMQWVEDWKSNLEELV